MSEVTTIQFQHPKQQALYNVCCVRSRLIYKSENGAHERDVKYWNSRIKQRQNYSQRQHVLQQWLQELREHAALPPQPSQHAADALLYMVSGYKTMRPEAYMVDMVEVVATKTTEERVRRALVQKVKGLFR